MAAACHAKKIRSKGKGHMLMKKFTVAWLLLKCAAAGMGLHISRTARVSS